jgi:subtilisin-like proprotein convertase family protein
VTVNPPNTLVNNRTADATAQDTQSETTLVLGSGSTVLSSFNDSGSNAGSAPHFTGTARSIDGGTTWTDQGILPNDANGDAGDPVYARNNTTGTVILATLGFNSGATLPTFRSTNDGSTYLSQVDGDGGGTSNDKEWLTCDNYAGTGNGNFYMFYRDFGSGGGMSFTRSTDGGATWSSRILLASASGQGAWVVVGADHAVYCFWLSGTSLVMRKSTDLGLTFGAQTTVQTIRSTGVNGDLGLGGGFRSNTFPQVVANPTDANQLYMVWDDKGISPSTDKANVYFSQSTNAGTSWSAPVQVNVDAGTNDNWQPVIAITPDGTALFVSWYDRRLDAGNTLIDVFGRNASISGTTVTFGNDYRISDGSWPVIIGQDPAINTVYMGDYDQAVADNTNFYRTWGDNRLSLLSHSNQPDVRFTKIPKAGPGAIVGAGPKSLIAENCTPANMAVDPGEMVTVSLGVTNVGTGPTTNLVGTLLATGGVTGPSGPATYGAVAVNATVSQNFTFVASGSCGGLVTASLQLQDGANNLGTVTYAFMLGTIGASLPVVTYSSGGVMVPIPDSGPMADQFITVPDVGAVVDVNVKIRLNHTFDGDLVISIVSPNGTAVTLSNRRGSSGDNFGSGATDCTGTFTVFDDSAGTPIASGSAPFAGSFKPDTVLSAINNSAANGTWTLKINDAASGDSGTLFCWQLDIIRAPFVCSASCGGGNLPPVANAGPDAAANSCTAVTLNGGMSSDPDNGPSPLSYAWSQTAGPTVVINGASTSAPSFEAPNVASSAMLTFQLTVSDGLAMASDSVVITVNHVVGVHVDTVGLYTTGANTYYLRNCNGPGPADVITNFGIGGYVPIRGDWDGNGTDTEGAYDPATGTFFLRNANTPGPADQFFSFGPAGATPIVGDWDGNGTVTIGCYIPATGTFFLRNSNTPGVADLAFGYGPANAVPIVGDWDGNGTTTVGVYLTATGSFFLKNSNAPGSADLVFNYGPGGAGVLPLAGDWDGTAGDSVGIYIVSSSAFFLKNTNASGPADIVFQFGAPANYTPLSGNWDGF